MSSWHSTSKVMSPPSDSLHSLQHYLGWFETPPFTTLLAAYTVALPTVQPRGSNASWICNATEYSANLECSPALENESNLYDGMGCGIAKSILFLLSSFGLCKANTTHIGILAGSGNGDLSNYVLEGNCSTNGRSRFAIVWEQLSPYGTIISSTALFGTPLCSARGVEVEIDDTGNILFTNISTPSRSFDFQIFNFSAFEELITLQIKYGQCAQDFFPVTLVLQCHPTRHDVRSYGVAGFALPFGPSNYTEFLHNETLYHSFNASFKLLFASAFSSLFTRPADPRILHGDSSTWQEAITAVRTFIILFECSLVVNGSGSYFANPDGKLSKQTS